MNSDTKVRRNVYPDTCGVCGNPVPPLQGWLYTTPVKFKKCPPLGFHCTHEVRCANCDPRTSAEDSHENTRS